MLFPQRFWPGIADGSVTVAMRRWKQPSVKAGGTLKSPAGLLQIEVVERVEPDQISEEDAIAAGYTTKVEAFAHLRPEGDLYRVRFRHAGEDPRIALRSQARLDRDELAQLRRRLARMEWAVPALSLIADHPGVVSTELAPKLGLERHIFKQRVRRLKELGLTESLDVGYRLSPRGNAVLEALRAPGT